MNDDDNTVDLLNDLLETCADAEACCRSAAEHAGAPELERVLTEIADAGARASAELTALVRQRGGEPEAGGSVAGKIERGWQAVTSKLGGGSVQRGWQALTGAIGGASPKALLDDCERVLGATVADYKKALNEPSLTETVRSVVDRQLDAARRRHDQIRHLRDRWSGVVADR